MAIRQWHVGRIVLLWVAAALPTALLFWSMARSADESFVGAVFIRAVGLVAVAFVATWIWFGNREQK
jgi:hypothetical protein